MNRDALSDWDIVTGVGITALWVAAARAIETHRLDALVTDPYAEAFVRAARPPVPMPTRLNEHGDRGADPEDLLLRQLWASIVTYVGVRSRFFDQFFAAAGAAGIAQVVFLAAGLDTRAFRLAWPAKTKVFEVDQPKVLAFKNQVLAEQGARSQCQRHTVGIDLHEDWPAALCQAGFDPARPTAWLAEGLLGYLPDSAKQALFVRIQDLSTPGSRIAVEHFGDIQQLWNEPRWQHMSRHMKDHFGFALTSLWPLEQDYDPAEWLDEHGWTITTVTAARVAADYERPLDDSPLHFVTASRLV